jgi:hypothetical protein
MIVTRILTFAMVLSTVWGQVRDRRPDDINMALVGPAEISLGEPLIIDLTFSNGGAGPVTVDLGANRITAFSLTLDAPDGSSVTVRPPEPDGFVAIGVTEIAPGQTITTWLVADEWLSISRAGRYRLQVRFVGTAVTSGGHSVAMERATELRFLVVPQDVARLRSTSERLAGLALRAPGVTIIDAQGRAVTALANVRNVVAIPSLVTVAAANRSPSIAIDGLLRIGGPEARAALVELSRNANRDVSDLARSALARVKSLKGGPHSRS